MGAEHLGAHEYVAGFDHLCDNCGTDDDRLRRHCRSRCGDDSAIADAVCPADDGADAAKPLLWWGLLHHALRRWARLAND